MAGERPDYNQLAAIQGLEGATLRVVAVDASGQIIMVPRGQAGNYMSVDASGYLSSIMKGIDGVTLRTIAVDAAGNILGLLQGDYMGAVKTLAVDAQGRMLAVLTDPEDVFGNPHYMGAAELAVRLGSIVNGDRLGNVLLMEDFESGIQKWAREASVGSTVRHSTLTAHNGAFSCELYADNVAGHYAYINRGITYPPSLTCLGVEMAFAPQAGMMDVHLWLNVYDGTTQHAVGMKYETQAKTLYYRNAALGWTLIATQPVSVGNIWIWNRLKFVIGLTTGNYVRAQLNSVEYDLSAVPMHAAASVTYPVISLTARSERNAMAANLYVDDIILTQEEP